MSKTFMYVSEMGGDCPIHGHRGTAFGIGLVRHACGCPVRRGEARMDEHDVQKAVQNHLTVEAV
jgi:hypothetical protein